MRALGLEERLRRISLEPATWISLKWDDTSLQFREPLLGGRGVEFGAPYLMAHRADLHRMLQGLVTHECIRLGSECVGAFSSDHGAVARFADGSEAEGDAVIGADGIRSAVRESLFGADGRRASRARSAGAP